jgi:hypothetical protein
MPSATYKVFQKAIATRKQVVCVYQGLEREVCPILLGHTDGEEKVLVWQFGGYTSKGRVRRPGEWKCLSLAGISKPVLRDGPWQSGGSHRSAQSCVADVEYDVNPDSPYVEAKPRACAARARSR